MRYSCFWAEAAGLAGQLKSPEEWCQSFPVTITDFIPRGETGRFRDGSVKVTVISRQFV